MGTKGWNGPLRFLALGVVVASVGIAAFLVARQTSGGGAGAQQEGTPGATGTAPDRGATPQPGATPDRSQPWWFIPYQNADREKADFAGTVGAIRIVNEPVDPFVACPDLRRVDAEGSATSISFGYLPSGAEEVEGSLDLAFWCGDELLMAETTFSVPGDPPDGRLGGNVHVFRYRGEAVAEAYLPEDRWSAGEIAGHQAAIGRAILPDIGLGESVVVVYDGQFVTRLTVGGLSYDELIGIAEGLFD